MALEIRKAHIHDAKALTRLGLLSGNITAAENELREFSESSDCKYKVVTDGEKILSLVLIRRSRLAHNADISLAITEEAKDKAKDILTTILDHCFIEKNIHKISTVLYGDNLYLENILAEEGFIQEAVLKDEIETASGFEDAGLFCLLRPEYRRYNYCFVPFALGVVAVGGDCEKIDHIRLLHYGDPVENPFAKDVAAHSGFLNDEGRLLPNKDNLYVLDESAGDLLPSEVWKAYRELTEYFDKKRSSFTVRYDLSDATPFQRKVWEALTKISYGNMRSYEDIAKDIAETPKQARNLTRAVGAACSDNPYPVIIPCHRVIGKDGTLVGFAAGLDIKDFLLTHETFSYIIPLNSDNKENNNG
ncbi:MAG: methylated-DNA--[protein]-cysteine S-methyltransferase [Clostridiales bacterium]|nr:methylated-DNA--[protein]-cysteine S-methyltransferase [Clostridiales bacterium]